MLVGIIYVNISSDITGTLAPNFGQKFYMLSNKKEYIRSDIVKMLN